MGVPLRVGLSTATPSPWIAITKKGSNPSGSLSYPNKLRIKNRAQGFPLQSLTRPSGGPAFGVSPGRQKSPPLLPSVASAKKGFTHIKPILSYPSIHSTTHAGLARSFCRLPCGHTSVVFGLSHFCPTLLAAHCQ